MVTSCGAASRHGARRMNQTFAPLRHPAFRMLWIANLASNTGMWVQSTGAGWLMTSLDPSAVMVSLVQAASLLPVFLLALPAGAIADLVDRRRVLIAAQLWMCIFGLLLAGLTSAGALGPWGLLALTFAIGAGSAVNFPAWAAVTPELVPRADLPQAIVLNGIGFNLTRAVGPALGGLIIGFAGAEAAFFFNALTFFVLIGALIAWKRAPDRQGRGEHLLSAIRAGIRFVVASPAMRAAIARAVAFFFFGSAVWGLLPLLVRKQLGLGPEAFGLMLGCMGVGAVAGGFAMPMARSRLDRGGVVLAGSLLAGASLVLLAFSHHWLPAALALLAYGVAWIAAASSLQAAAQFAAPAWVRARAIGIYQVAFFGALAAGSALAGWLGSVAGLPFALALFGAGAIVAGLAVRGFSLEGSAAPATAPAPLPQPEAPAPELGPALRGESGRVLEVVRYTVAPEAREGFLAAMEEVRRVRLRAGAMVWRLYEDVAHPERFVELWAVESWAEHLREQKRLEPADVAALAAAARFQSGDAPPEAARYLAVRP
jgi:MFS family permease